MNFSIVKIPDGELKGTEITNINGEKFYSFLGIPFAKPPLGKLRFKAPQPIEPWQGIKDVTKESNICYQLDQSLQGSEDCLNLHVFTKTLPSQDNSLNPVMVWIHGGGFRTGSNSIKNYGPEYLMNENIVLVSINYRLGFLGSLHLNDTSLEVPGNAGIKDQQFALKWVQKNIKYFNGDPNNVTIFGESAGSVSVELHILSSTSKGLFHKAIMQSGSVLNPWALSDQSGLEFAKSIQADIESEKDALDLLRKLSVEELYDYQEKFYETKGGTRLIFAPNIETPNPTAMITEHPVKLLISGKYNHVPILMGYNDREGMFFGLMEKMCLASGKKIPDRFRLDDLNSFIHHEMHLKQNDPRVEEVKDMLKKFYYEGKYVNDRFLLPSDYYFLSGIIGAAKHHSRVSSYPVYLYRVSLDAGLNTLKKSGNMKNPGVCHADELGYLFQSNSPQTLKGDVETVAINRFVKLWTNFAKTGNPTPKDNDLGIEVQPIVGNQINFFDIGLEISLHTNPEEDRMELWKQIYQLSPNTFNYLL